jgi:hypothetical protein
MGQHTLSGPSLGLNTLTVCPCGELKCSYIPFIGRTSRVPFSELSCARPGIPFAANFVLRTEFLHPRILSYHLRASSGFLLLACDQLYAHTYTPGRCLRPCRSPHSCVLSPMTSYALWLNLCLHRACFCCSNLCSDASSADAWMTSLPQARNALCIPLVLLFHSSYSDDDLQHKMEAVFGMGFMWSNNNYVFIEAPKGYDGSW